MKFLKKATALLMAVFIAVPSNIAAPGTVYAEDNTRQYTVSIEEPENGSMSFTDYGAADISLNKGDTVEVDMYPDSGYEVSEFQIKDAETGDVIGSRETADDHFEFSMPGYDIIVTGEFEVSDKVTETAAETEEVSDFANPTQIIVGTSDGDIFRDTDKIISSLDGLWIVEYPSYELAEEAAEYFRNIADFAELNGVYAIDEGEVTVSEEEMEELESDTDAFTEVSEILESSDTQSQDTPDYSGYIALIDTGVTHDIEKLSVLGDDGTDVNGHGDKMYDFMTEEFSGVKVISVKAFNENGHAQASDIYAAIKLAESMNVSVINLSASSYKTAESETVKTAVLSAYENGITFVGAAGNKNADVKYFVPGSVDEAVIIGSCTSDGKKQDFSNYGDTVDYYVVSDSTSEAAARYSAIIAGNVSSDKVFVNAETDDTDTEETEGDVATWEEYLEALEAEDWSDYPDYSFGVDYSYGVSQHGEVKVWESYQNFSQYGTEEGDCTFEKDSNGYGYINLPANSAVYKTTGQQRFLTECEGHIGNSTKSKGATSLSSGQVHYRATPTVSTSGNVETISWKILITNKKDSGGNWTYDVSWSTKYGKIDEVYITSASSTDAALRAAISREVATGGYTGKLNAQYYTRSDENRGSLTYRGETYSGPVYNVGYTYLGANGQQTFTTSMSAKAPIVSKLKIKKTVSSTAGCADMVSGNPNYSLEGAVYGVYSDSSASETGRIGTLTTDANGDTPELELNVTDGTTVYVKEITAPKGYQTDTTIYSKQVSAGNTVTVDVSDVPVNDPIRLILTKSGSAGTKLSGAKFRLNYYAVDTSQYGSFADVSGITPTKSWVFETASDGIIDTWADNALEGSSEFYYNEGGRVYPLGVYTLVEESPSAGYLNQGTMAFDDNTSSAVSFTDGNAGLYFEVQEVNDAAVIVDSTGTQVGSAGAENIPASVVEVPAYFGFSLTKRDADTDTNSVQGNAENLSVTIKVINRSGYPVTVDGNANGTSYADGAEVMRFTTNPDGTYTSAGNKLQAGVYEFVEVPSGNGGYLSEDKRGGNTLITFPSSATSPQTVSGIVNGTVYTIDNTVMIEDAVKRGGFAVEKLDADSLLGLPQGDASALDAEITLYNRSIHNVLVDTDGDGVMEAYAPNAAIMSVKLRKLLTDTYAYMTDTHFLPYGSYEIKETGAPSGYLTAGGDGIYSIKFTISDEGQYHVFGTEEFVNAVKALTSDGTEAALRDAVIANINSGRYNITAAEYYAIIEEIGLSMASNVAGDTITVIKNILTAHPELAYIVYNYFEDTPLYGYGAESYVEHTLETLINETYKGTFAVEKHDADSNTNDPQGNAADLKAEFQLINMSLNTVYVDVNRDGTVDPETEKFAKNEVIMTFETDESGRYVEKVKDFLPFGTYKIKEITAADGYLNDTVRGGRTEITFSITKDNEFFVSGSDEFKAYAETINTGMSVTHEKTEVIEDPVMRGKITIKKNDADMKAYLYDGLTGLPYSNDYTSKYAQGELQYHGRMVHKACF